MSRNQWIAIALFAVAVGFVLGIFAGYLLISLTGTFLPQTSGPAQPIDAATQAPADTPTAVEISTPLSAAPTATPEPPTPTSTRGIPETTYTLPHGPTVIPTEAVTPDDWEPDNNPGEASLIQVGETQRHNLHVEGDYDLVYFAAQEGATYVIETSNLGRHIDTIIHLYGEEGNELASDDDGGDQFWASRLWWTATEEGTLYIAIHDFGDNEAGPGTSYDISLSPGEAFEIDEYEPDNSRPGANEIAVGEPQTHNLHIAADRDWVCFEAEEGMTYVIETSNLGGDIDTIVYLYDEEGNELASDDDKGGELLASRLEWTATEDGTLYVMGRDLWSSSAGPGSEYDISVSFR